MIASYAYTHTHTADLDVSNDWSASLCLLRLPIQWSNDKMQILVTVSFLKRDALSVFYTVNGLQVLPESLVLLW